MSAPIPHPPFLSPKTQDCTKKKKKEHSLSKINRFINSNPNDAPATQNTSSPTYTCHPIHVPKKKLPSPPVFRSTRRHDDDDEDPPDPMSAADTSGRTSDDGPGSYTSSSSSSDVMPLARLRGYGDGVRDDRSTSGTMPPPGVRSPAVVEPADVVRRCVESMVRVGGGHTRARGAWGGAVGGVEGGREGRERERL